MRNSGKRRTQYYRYCQMINGWDEADASMRAVTGVLSLSSLVNRDAKEH